MSLPADSAQTSLTRASLLQKYFILHSQRDALQQYPEPVASSKMAEPSYIASTNPFAVSRRQSFSSPESNKDPGELQINKLLYSGYATQFDLKLIDINQQIKVTLTELGNLRDARNDQRFKEWVQARLLDAERQICHRKTQINRRRSVA